MSDPLLQGFKQFHKEVYEGNAELMPRLINEGQSPDYFIISCIDSRSNPGMIFRPEPGTFFAHKAMGAIVRPYKKGTALAAALQFALKYNKVKKIIILAHTGCGAIKALVDKVEDEEIAEFIKVAQKGLEKAKKLCSPECGHTELLRHAEEQTAIESAANLRLYPSVAEALAEGRVQIEAWIFDMDTGNLLAHDASKDKFLPITFNIMEE